jgi:hypothetical protein
MHYEFNLVMTPSLTLTGGAVMTGSTAPAPEHQAPTAHGAGMPAPAAAHALTAPLAVKSSPVASTILKVLEDIWLEIRRWNPEIPAVVIIIASGTDGKHPRWGHHAPDRWNVAGEQLTEIMISGEGLRRTAREVLATLLHEAAHALAHARGIKDTSRQGRYHNTKFKKCAEELGLAVEHDDNFGWSVTTITPATELAYASQLQALADAMTLWRHGETTAGPKARRNTNLIAAICPCGRSIRVAASTLAEAPITCQACDQDFQAKNPADA